MRGQYYKLVLRFLKYREGDKCDPTLDSTCSVKTSSWTGFAVLAAELFGAAVKASSSGKRFFQNLAASILSPIYTKT